MDFDEIGTFGLSNNTFQLDIEDFKEYSGEELLLKYAAVKDGEEFNVSNVFFNQKMDTHPPPYYMIVNFICSLRKGTFSMWYGLIINLIFMVALFWEMRYLFNLLIEDEIMSTVLSMIAFFTYGFVNEIVFIRMYVMLSVISMAFVIFVIKIIKSYQFVGADIIRPTVGTNKTVGASYASPHIKTFIIFFTLCLLGILTQYHFMIIAFYFSLVLGIFLIYKKDFKLLLSLVAAGVLSIVTSLIIFPGIINHMFGNASLHALNNTQVDSLATRCYELIKTIHRSFFGIGFLPYLVILLLSIIICIVTYINRSTALVGANAKSVGANAKSVGANAKSVGANAKSVGANAKSVGAKHREPVCITPIKWFLIFIFCCIFYYLVIAFTVKFSFARYLYNIYPLIIVCIVSSIYLLLKSINQPLKYISVAVIIMLAFTSRFKAFPFTKENEDIPFSLNAGSKTYEEYLMNNRQIKILGIYSTVDKRGRSDTQGTSLWKIHRPLYSFRNMEAISFVNLNNNQDILYTANENISKNNSLFVVIYIDEENDEEILGAIMQNNGFTNVNRVYFNTYYHMYLITKQ